MGCTDRNLICLFKMEDYTSARRPETPKIPVTSSQLRKALYMPTLVATQRDPVIQAYYQRLLARGKAKKVALIACMRKLLTILNAMVRKLQPWSSLEPLTP